MTFDDFVKKYLGKKVDWDNAYGGQCVDLFRQYVNDVLKTPQPKAVAGAADFWTNYDTDPNLKNNFDKIPNTPTGIPLKGDVMLWNKKAGGGFGHVSIFISGTANLFTSFDQNYPTLSVCTKTEHGYQNVYGWLHPKTVIIPTPTTDDLQTILSHYKVKTAQEFIASNDQQLQYLTDARNQITGLNTTLKTAQDKFSTFVQNIVDKLNPIHPIAGMVDETVCLGLIDELVASVSQTQSELKNQQKLADAAAAKAKERERELMAQIEELTKKADDLQEQVADLKQDIADVKSSQASHQQQTAQNATLQSFISKIFNLFKRN